MKIINNKNAVIAFILKHVSCTCFIYLFAFATANAVPLKNAHGVSKPKVKLSFVPANQTASQPASKKPKTLDLTLRNNDSSHIDFKKMRPKNKIKQIKERYLTIYSRKKEKLKATYLQGSYAINYTQSW